MYLYLKQFLEYGQITSMAEGSRQNVKDTMYFTSQNITTPE